MKTVADVLRNKPNQQVHSITPDASVLEAISRMAETGIGALMVMEGERVVGILSERDYARKVVLMDRSSQATPVCDIMTSAVMFVHPSQTITECMELMTEKRLRHLPVMVNDRLLGMVSIGDLVKEVISEQRDLIQQLEQYIRGG